VTESGDFDVADVCDSVEMGVLEVAPSS